MGWNNKNCCCEPKTYTCGDGEVNICCMTLQASTWARALSAYANNTDPDSLCGYVDSPHPHNNVCGSVSSFNACDSLPSFRIFWGIQADGTVRLCLELYSTLDGDGNYVPPVFHCVTGLDPDTWYTAPVVFTVSGVTYTIEVCPDPHDYFPEWPLTDVFYELRDSTGALIRSTGNVLCGEECDPSRFLWGLKWRYNVYTDEITIPIFAQVRTGPFTLSNYTGTIVVPYDDGNWSDADYTTSLTAPGVADLTVSVLRVDSCTIPPPPPPCEVGNACWPDLCPCLVNGSTGEIYRTIYADVSGDVTVTGLPLTPNGTGDGFHYNQALPGNDYVVIQCTSEGLDPYYVAARFLGVTYFCSIPANGLECDGENLVDEIVGCGGITIRFYTL